MDTEEKANDKKLSSKNNNSCHTTNTYTNTARSKMALNDCIATALLSETDRNVGDIDIDTLSDLFAQVVAVEPQHNKRSSSLPLQVARDPRTDFDQYEGQTKSGRAHGSGKIILASGDKYEGIIFIPHGMGVYNYAVNGRKFTGEFVNGKRNGRGLMEWKNGTKYFGEWNDDNRHGRGVLMYFDGGVYSGQWRNGMFHGDGRATYANGDKYKGQYENGKRHGKGKMVWRNGSEYDGGWKEGKQHGKGTYTAPDGTKKGEWKNGKFQTQEVEDVVVEVEITGQFSAIDLVSRNVKEAEENGDVIDLM